MNMDDMPENDKTPVIVADDLDGGLIWRPTWDSVDEK